MQGAVDADGLEASMPDRQPKIPILPHDFGGCCSLFTKYLLSYNLDARQKSRGILL
jgi:hypothetical protein